METIPTAADDLRADVIRRVKDEDITFIQLWFTDVVGRLKASPSPSASSRMRSCTGWGSTARR